MTDEYELPPCWVATRIVDVLTLNSNGKPFQQGFSPQCDSDSAAPHEWGVLKTTAIQENDFWEAQNKRLPESIPPREHLEVASGDIVMTCAGPRSRCGIACYVHSTRAKLLLSGKMYRFRTIPDAMEPRFLMHFLATKQAQAAIDRMKTGINDSGLNLTHDRFAELVIPVAPLNEQRRIVEKIETLFARLDKGEEALREVRKLLAHYRQSVLKAAVTGQLTAEWRAENAHRLEHGRDLLARILQTRRETWQGRGQYKEPAAPDTTDLPDLPEGWTWASLDALIVDGPTNGVSPKETAARASIKSFKLTATTSGKFLINEQTIKHVGIELEPSSKYWLKRGDVLIQRGNTIEYVGTAAMFPGPDDEYIFPDLMMRVRFADEILARWVVPWANFELAKKYIRRNATGTAGNMPKINGTTLKSLPVPLPSLAEQSTITEILDAKFSEIEALEAWCVTELARSASLRQSILKGAFAGRLVPQDPADEPAAALLARIKTEGVVSRTPRRTGTAPQ